MLSDWELDRIAAEWARSSVSGAPPELRVDAIRKFVLDAPNGIYYHPRVEPEDEEVLILGGAGFFVDRNTGEVTQFAMDDLREAMGEPFHLYWDRITPAIIRIALETRAASSLRAHLDQGGTLMLDEAIGIIRDLGRELLATHRQPPIHGWIRPECVRLTTTGATFTSWCIDPDMLGLSLDPEIDPQPFDRVPFCVAEDPAHFSPEQVAGSLNLDRRSDQYSLASLLFELLTGQPPFVAERRQLVVALKAENPAPRLASRIATVSAMIDAAVARALSTDPDDRFPTLEAFLSSLQKQ